VKHGEGNTNSPELSFLPLANHHSHFLAATLDFTFFTMAFLGPHTFLQLGSFGLDHNYNRNNTSDTENYPLILDSYPQRFGI